MPISARPLWFSVSFGSARAGAALMRPQAPIALMAPLGFAFPLSLLGATFALVVQAADLHSSAVVGVQPGLILLGVVVALVGSVGPAFPALGLASRFVVSTVALCCGRSLASCQVERGWCCEFFVPELGVLHSRCIAGTPRCGSCVSECRVGVQFPSQPFQLLGSHSAVSLAHEGPGFFAKLRDEPADVLSVGIQPFSLRGL